MPRNGAAFAVYGYFAAVIGGQPWFRRTLGNTRAAPAASRGLERELVLRLPDARDHLLAALLAIEHRDLGADLREHGRAPALLGHDELLVLDGDLLGLLVGL